MKTLIVTLKGLFCALVGLLAPIYMIVLVFFIKWDPKPSHAKEPPQPDDLSFIIRGNLPKSLQWAQTMDSRFPGGMYEPTITKLLGNGSYLRRLLTSYIWCGHRNRAQGLPSLMGFTVDKVIPPRTSAVWYRRTFRLKFIEVLKYQDGPVWQTWLRLGPIYLVYGYEVYTLNNGTFRAVPICTLKKA